jgi:hypothetical protein
LARSGNDLSRRLVFLVGARRSGTNWLHTLMAMHPALVKVPSETHLFYTLAQLQERFQHGLIGSANTGATYLPRQDMIEAFRDLCDRAFAIQLATYGGPGQLLIERTPLHAKHLDLIGEIYPAAPVVHLIRNGRDVAASLVRQSWGPASLRDAAMEWVDTVQAARAHRAERYHEVRHEALVADVAGTMTDLCEFLGCEVSDDLRALWREAASRPINATPDGHRREASGSSADEEQRREIDEVAGALLQELGYDEGQPSGADQASPAASARRRRGKSGQRRRVRAEPSPATRRGAPVLGDEMQRVVDQMLSALERREPASLAAVLSPSVEVRLHDPVRVLTAADGMLPLASALIDVASPTGRQVRGDSFPGWPSFTIMWVHDDQAGRVHRVLVVTVDDMLLITGLEVFVIAEADRPGPDVAATRRSTP